MDLESSFAAVANFSLWAYLIVFAGGVLTSIGPCNVAMIPLVIGFVGGYEGISGWKKSLGFSLVFVFGLAVSFTVMGVAAVTLGRLFGDVGSFWPWIIAAILALGGGFLLELLFRRFMKAQSILATIIVTIGASLIIRESALHIWDEKNQRLSGYREAMG